MVMSWIVYFCCTISHSDSSFLEIVSALSRVLFVPTWTMSSVDRIGTEPSMIIAERSSILAPGREMTVTDFDWLSLFPWIRLTMESPSKVTLFEGISLNFMDCLARYSSICCLKDTPVVQQKIN